MEVSACRHTTGIRIKCDSPPGTKGLAARPHTHDHHLLSTGHPRPPDGDRPMNVQVTSRPTAQAPATSKLAIADGDIHPQRNSYKDLFPYMEVRWVEMAKPSGPLPRQAHQAGPAYPKVQPNASLRDALP